MGIKNNPQLSKTKVFFTVVGMQKVLDTYLQQVRT